MYKSRICGIFVKLVLLLKYIQPGINFTRTLYEFYIPYIYFMLYTAIQNLLSINRLD
jgi:hypothetical protein